MKKLILLYYTLINYLFNKCFNKKSKVSLVQVFPNENTLYFTWSIEFENKNISSILDENYNMAWYTTKVDAQKACARYLIKNYLW